MARRGRPAVALAAFAFAAATGAVAQQSWEPGLILSDSDGRGTHIAASDDLREGLDPLAVSGPDIVAEFKRLCLDTGFDSAAHAQAALDSSWRFRRNEIVLKKLTKHGAFAFTDYRSASAITSLWRGENGAALDMRDRRIRMRGAILTSFTISRSLSAPQCNLSLRTSGLSDAAPLAAALEQALGQPAAKLVLKTGFADGHWKLAGPSDAGRRVSFDVVDMKKSAQLVHLSVRALPAAKP